MDETQNILRMQFQKLPKNLQEVILSAGLQEKLKRIFKKFNLHIDQAGALENETMLVMLGLESAGDYIENIKKALDITEVRAHMITADVNKEIFTQIREMLKKISQLDEKTDELKTVENPPAGGKEREIHYPNLANSSSNGQDIDKKEESEEIKRYIAQQQNTKPTAPPPPNLPTDNLEASPPSEKKRPYSSDPYREPVE